MPMDAPIPLVIIMNNPCALERMLLSVSLFTNSEPEMLKKSNATPYTIIERMNQVTAGKLGLPMAKKPNRKAHATMAISITRFIPYRFKKKGISKIQSVSEICESEISKLA